MSVSQTSYSSSGNGGATMTATWQSGSTWLIRYSNNYLNSSGDENNGTVLIRVPDIANASQSNTNPGGAAQFGFGGDANVIKLSGDDDNEWVEFLYTFSSSFGAIEGGSEGDGYVSSLNDLASTSSYYVSLSISDTGASGLQAGDMVGLVMSVDHQDRNSDEDTEDWTQAAFFVNFDTFNFSASNNGNTATQSAINLDTASHPLAYWSFNREDAWYGVGDNHENIYSGSLGSGFEHTATIGAATYKIRYRLIEKNNIPAGLSTDFSGYSSSTTYGIINGSTSDSFHDFTQGGSPDTYLKTWTNTSNISSGGTNNTRAYNWIEAYVYEVVGGGGGGASASGAVDVTVRGMDASHNTLATDTEATTFDSSKYYRVNVNAIGVDHWGWNIDGGSETMMPAGSTYFVVNGADYQGTGGSSTIAVGQVVGMGAYGVETQTSSQDSDEDEFRYIVLDGIFDSVSFPLYGDCEQNERADKTFQGLIDDYGIWRPDSSGTQAPGYSGVQKSALEAIINAIPTTSTNNAWHVNDVRENGGPGLAASPGSNGTATTQFTATIGNTTYTLGFNAAVYTGPINGQAAPYLRNNGNDSFWTTHCGISRNIQNFSIYEIKVISIETFDTSNRSLWGGTNYPKLDIFYAHGHGGTYNGYGTGYTKTFINWTQDYGFGFGNPRGDSWMWTHTGHTGPVYGYRKIKGRWLGDARGLGDDDGTPVHPGYNFGFWAQPHASPPADGIYPDGSTRPHSANVSASSHSNIKYNGADVTDSNGVMTWERAMMGPISDVMEYDVTLGNQNLAGQSSYSTFRGITFDENVTFGLRSTSWDEGSDGETQGTTFRGAAFLVVGFQDDAGVWHYKDEYL